MLSKTSIIPLISFVFVVALLTGSWFYFVGASSASGQWADFGTYVGGVLTPLTILVALLALIQRDSEYRVEMNRLTKESHKIDLLRFIENIESEINSEFSRATLNVGNMPYPFRDLLFKHSFLEWENAIPTSDKLIERSEKEGGIPRHDQDIFLWETLSAIATNINRLREHCNEYDRLAGNNFTSLNYSRKYKLASRRLNAKGYNVDVWELNPQSP